MMESRAFIVGLIVGILATVTMDVVAVIALRLGIAGRGPRRTGPDLIGRWIGYLLRGKFRHTDILQTPPLLGELVLGLAAHYLIGIVLTLVYLGLLLVVHATPTALGAILYGTATTVFPWFLMSDDSSGNAALFIYKQECFDIVAIRYSHHRTIR